MDTTEVKKKKSGLQSFFSPKGTASTNGAVEEAQPPQQAASAVKHASEDEDDEETGILNDLASKEEPAGGLEQAPTIDLKQAETDTAPTTPKVEKKQKKAAKKASTQKKTPAKKASADSLKEKADSTTNEAPVKSAPQTLEDELALELESQENSGPLTQRLRKGGDEAEAPAEKLAKKGKRTPKKAGAEEDEEKEEGEQADADNGAEAKPKKRTKIFMLLQ